MVNTNIKLDYDLNINYDKILGADWAGILEDSLLDTDYMKNLMLFLHEIYKTPGVYPAKADIFRTFTETEFSKIKIVILGGEPYPDIKSIGIPLGNNEVFGVEYSEELKKWNKGIENEFYDGFRMYNNPTLTDLSRQGVLLLNCSLTSVRNKKFAHIVYWKNFIRQVLKSICEWHPATIFIFMGEEAKSYDKFIGNTGYKFFCEHPSESIEKKHPWSAHALKAANEILKKLNGDRYEIIW